MRTQEGLDSTRGSPARRRPLTLGLSAALLTIGATLIFVGQASAQSSPAGRSNSSQSFFGPIVGLFPDSSGVFANVSSNPGVVNRSNAFFDPSLGTNGQACVTCHQPNQGFSVTVPFIDSQFDRSDGKDPLFRANDTATQPDADLTTRAKRREAFQLALELGVFRIGKTFPNVPAEFTVQPQKTTRFGQLPNPNDPQIPPNSPPGTQTLSLFRRPLATTNMRLESVVLWDGRQNIHNLRTQVSAAAITLMLAKSVDPGKADNVASFMTSVFTAQDVTNGVGLLSILGADGGAHNLRQLALSSSAPCVPMTDPKKAGTFTPPVTPPPTGCFLAVQPFNLYTAWSRLPSRTGFASVARGEELFNTRQFTFPGIPGTFSCTACHTTTNVGNFPFVDPEDAPPPPLFVRYGLDSPEFLAQLARRDKRLSSFVDRTKGLPVYSITPTVSPADCGPAILPDLETRQPILSTLNTSTDPGRAMVTGKCADLGGFKPPILRGLATRAPYFHNGAAATIEDVVNFYDTILQAKFTNQDRADLAAFLRSL
jgi:cytochrome c peroxidase